MRPWFTFKVLALVLAMATPALAGEAGATPKPKTGVSRILKSLNWKASSADVLDQVKVEMDQRYQKRISRHVDTLTVDRVLREKRAAFAKIKKGQVHFDGGRSGYEASVVGEEFRANDGESMLRVDDQQAQRYYFFKHDALWKIVVVYNASISSRVDFAGFVKQIKGNYGAPTKLDWHTPAGGTRTLRGAEWADGITHLAVEDRREFFGTYLMRFVDKADGLPIEARRKGGAAKGTAAGSDFTDGMLADIMGGDNGEESANVVDQLTGANHDVDLTTGRPKDDPVLDRSGVIAPVDRAPAKPAKASAKTKQPRQAPAPDASGEPYIIY